MKLSVSVEAEGVNPTGISVEAAAPLTLLMVSENEQPHIFVRHALTRAGWAVISRFSVREALEISEQPVPVALCDCDLSEDSWKSLLNAYHEMARPPRLIVFCRYADVKLWAEVLNLGAYDLLMYPFDLQEVLRATSLAWESWKREGLLSKALAATAHGAGRPGKSPGQASDEGISMNRRKAAGA